MKSNHDKHEGDRSKDGGGHTNHEEMFRRKFWISTLLSIPVLVLSETVQAWWGYSIPAFPLSNWITSVFSIIVFIVGGLPFFRMA